MELQPKTFGSPIRTRILITISVLGETYPAELARLLKAPLVSVQRIVDSLERERLVATRRRGKERIVTLNPDSVIARELKQLLIKLAQAYPEYSRPVTLERARPRRKGKTLLPFNDKPTLARRKTPR
jgi:DNA-binding transcriptional ArsR family regulator